MAADDLPESANYSDKKETILTACKKGKGIGEVDAARGIALDGNQAIYIADMENSCIQMFSFQLEFIRKFGEDHLDKPYGITLTDDHIYVTSLHSLQRFDKKNLQLVDRVGGGESERGLLINPHGLAVDTNGDVFIANSCLHKVCVFSKQLKLLSCIGQEKLHFPQDISLTIESVVVLDWSDNCVHFFTRDGEHLSSCVTQGSKKEFLVYRPFFFCLDQHMNVIVSDNYFHKIKIMSRSGELIHMIESSKIKRPQGIAISDAGNIYIVSDNPDCILLAF